MYKGSILGFINSVKFKQQKSAHTETDHIRYIMF